LEWTTYSGNTAHGWRMGSFAHRVAVSPKGEANGKSFFKAEDVLRIRAIYAEGKLTQTQIGLLFRVKKATIQAICSRRNWKHI
jgi:hypothetical protein